MIFSPFDIFQEIASTSEPAKELVIRELLNLNVTKWIPKTSKCPLQWWGKHEVMFPTIGFFGSSNFRHCRVTN
jgi:hypothetical protein